jgi:eukaryotic-like serine/threonine-protein kinase
MSAPEGGPVRIGDRYRVEERIGTGAMGAVWLAVDELLSRTVAMKELLAVLPGTSAAQIEESRQRILREGRIGARLQHPNVISTFDLVVDDDRPWLVMEYLPSESLAQRLSRHGPLPATEVAEIGRQVADGLAAAHQAGVVHRDVKPGNVLIAAHGLVKLTDFGVSRAADDVQLTRTGVIAGTPAYLAPEVAQGRQPTAASDVFALGATLYAAVEGTPPFGLDDNAYALLHKVATSEPEPPRLAGPLAGILMRLLDVRPERRPSAAQARDLLAAVAVGHTVAPADPFERFRTEGAPPEGETQEPVRVDRPIRSRRAPALLSLLLGVLVVVAGATIVTLAGASSGRAAAPPAAAPAATAAPATPSMTVASRPAASPAAAPPGAVSPASASTFAAASTPSPAPSSRRAASPTPRPAPASVPAPAPATPQGADPVTFVQRYYALLPGNTDAAYALLGPQARSQAGGAAGFASFYARMQSVTVNNSRLVGDNTVSATVRFVQKDGTTSNEPYQFHMTTDNSGRMIMDSFVRT